MARIVVGISGASGMILAYRALTALGELGHEIELVVTEHALYTMALELKLGKKWLETLPEKVRKKITLHPIYDIGSSICSGSYPTDGMVIIPCSMATLAAIACGLSDNCLRRAADVTIKEKRPLVIVPREAPLSELHLENMLRLTRFGATIVPPMPAWYTYPKTLEDVEQFIVGKTFDALKISHSLYPRWKTDQAKLPEVLDVSRCSAGQ